MKTIICIILATLSLAVKSQSVFIYSISPYTVCPGDSLTVKFTWDSSPWAVNFNLKYNNNTINTWNIQSGSIYSLTKYKLGVDTIYSIKIKIPNWTAKLDYTFDASSNGTSNSKNLIVDCQVVGIHEYYENKWQDKYYYNLLGSEIIIENTGLKTKKYIVID